MVKVSNLQQCFNKRCFGCGKNINTGKILKFGRSCQHIHVNDKCYCLKCSRLIKKGIAKEVEEIVKSKTIQFILEKIIEVRKNNPYPEDIFTEPSKNEKHKLVVILKKHKIVQDRHFGSFGRKVWNNCLNEIKKELMGK